MLKRILLKIWGNDLERKERFFRLILVMAIFTIIIGFVETIIVFEAESLIIPVLLLMFVLCIVIVATFKYRKIEFASVIFGIVLIAVIFPIMFFMCGGLESGAAIWFSIAIFYVFMMFSGKKMAIFLTFTVIVDIVTYYVAYNHPELVMPVNSLRKSYFDSLFAMIIVGFAAGIFFKFYAMIYEAERKKTEEQKKELERINQSKTNFFANMSHEIRTPLNTIIGLDEMILRESDEKQTKEYAANIKEAGNILLSLVNDILDISKAGMNKLEMIPADYEVREFFNEIAMMIKVQAEEKKLEFVMELDDGLPARLNGDEKRVRQVLVNLLSNAVKYTDSGSVSLKVGGEYEADDNYRLVMSVVDTGIGIRKEEIKNLYDAYTRADQKKNNNIEGTGLGLSITKQIVELMGGSISVDSIYTKGSTFTCDIVQKVADRTPIGLLPSVNEKKEASSYHKMFEAPEGRILIVDDNKMNAMVSRELLLNTRMQIDVAYSGAECLEKTESKFYHIILMDHMMRGMDGVDTLNAVRNQKNGLCRESVVLLMSADAVYEMRQICNDNSFDGFVEKPMDLEKLEKVLAGYLPKDIIEYGKDVNKEEDNGLFAIVKGKFKRKKKLIITTDSASNLSENVASEFDIRVIPFYINTLQGRYLDIKEISSDDFIGDAELINSNGIYAECPSTEEYEKFFASVLTEAENVLYISMAAGSGESFDRAKQAAASFDNVYVIDSAFISCAQSLVVIKAAMYAAQGHEISEICKEIECIKKKIHYKFTVPSSDMISAGIYSESSSSRFLRGIGLKPEFSMKKGVMRLCGVHIAEFEKMWNTHIIVRLVYRRRKYDTGFVIISMAGCKDKYKDMIKQNMTEMSIFENIIYEKASITTACYSGMAGVGIAYLVK